VEPDNQAAVPTPAGKKTSQWLLEGAFIVLSVALGFAVSQFGEYRNDRQLAQRMLQSIRTEVEYNARMLEPFVPFHREWRDRLTQADSKAVSTTGVDFLFAARPPLPPQIRTNVPLLRHAAWDTATSTGALRLIDYDLAAGFSEIYSLQQYAASTFSSLFGQSAFYDPGGGPATARLAQTTMQEMTWTEEQLIGLYEKQLTAVRTGPGR
jgi:hypothetical protein